MKRYILSRTILLNVLLLASSVQTPSMLAASTIQVPLVQTPSVRASILQTQIVPYIQTENTETQYQSSQEQLAVVEQELAVTQEDLVTAQDQLATTQDQLSSTQDELTQAESEIQSLIDSCSSSDPACASELESTQELLLVTRESYLDALVDIGSLSDELESTQVLLSASDSIIDQATDLINNPAIPDASAIDAILSDLFGYTPTFIDSLATDPLVPRIQDGLLPYLQAALEKLGDYSKIVKVSAGQGHLVVLTQGGRVYGAGANGDGQLGLGNDEEPFILTPMIGEGTSGVTDIAAGIRHTVILKGDKVYATGANGGGQLGIGNFDNKTTLTEMAGEGMSGVSAIAAGGEHTLVLKSGAVYGAGYSNSGPLGIGSLNLGPQPYLVAMIGEGTSGVIALAAGEYHSLILKDTGAVYGCGISSNGRLGMGSNIGTGIIATTTAMIGEGEAGVDAIAAGYTHSLVLKGGKVYGTGTNDNGELGIGTVVTPVLTLTEAIEAGESGVTAIACDDRTSYIIKDNKAYAVGQNGYGQLGIGITSVDPISSFTAMIGEGLSGVTDITAGQRFAAVVKDDKAYGVGRNFDGQLGIGTYVDVNVLTKSQRQL